MTSFSLGCDLWAHGWDLCIICMRVYRPFLLSLWPFCSSSCLLRLELLYLVRSSSRGALKPRAIRETCRTRYSMNYNRSNENFSFLTSSISWCSFTLAPRLMHACVHMCVGDCVKLLRWKYSVIKAVLISKPYTSVPPSVRLYRCVRFLCCA